MPNQPVVSHEEWTAARKELLRKEKDFTKARDRLSRERRALPWEKVEKSYVFEGPRGRATLGDLFAGKSQLVVYHFMFDPAWDAGCKLCSFWADNFERNVIHLRHRDVQLVAVSRAPLPKLKAYRKRMGWSFDWYSSSRTDFNFDFQVSCTPEQVAKGKTLYNYEETEAGGESPGVSVFFKDAGGTIFHTYSCYARGLDILNTAYNYLDLVPKGRDEQQLPWPMAWVRRRDSYEDELPAKGKRRKAAGRRSTGRRAPSGRRRRA